VSKSISWAIAMAATLFSVHPAPARCDAGPVPEIRVEAPDSLAAQRRRLERVDRERLVAGARLVGLDEPGPPIRVLLAPADSPLARDTPAAIVAFASGDLVVVFPGRTPSYPHETMEEVLQHEVAHVLINRAAGGHRVPRWFHEGVARQAELTWNLGERTRYLYEMAAGGTVSPSQLDALFGGDTAEVARAYVVSSAFVQHLLAVYGPALPSRVLRAMRAGHEFEPAFFDTTGLSVGEANDEFWRSQRFWLTWFPWVTSTQAVYTVMTVLAIAAIWRVRARRAARDRETTVDDEAEGAEGADVREESAAEEGE
jgi:hypothetical protein